MRVNRMRLQNQCAVFYLAPHLTNDVSSRLLAEIMYLILYTQVPIASMISWHVWLSYSFYLEEIPREPTAVAQRMWCSTADTNVAGSNPGIGGLISFMWWRNAAL